MNKRGRSLFLIFGIIFFIAIVYATSFSDTTQSNFNSGTYTNTSYNGTAVILNGSNLSGTFTSRIFDAVSVSSWDNLSWDGNLPNRTYLYAFDNVDSIHRSSDFGATWTRINSTYFARDIQGVVSNTNGLFVVALNGGGGAEIHRSTNSGVTWTLMNNTGISSLPRGIASDLNNNLYVVATSDRIYKSTNSGATWTLVNSSYSSNANGNVYGIAFDGTYLFVSDNANNLFRSSDFGATWTSINSTYFGNNIQGITSNSNGLFAVTALDREVHKSTNSGATWTTVNTNSLNNAPFGMTSDSNNFLYIVAGNDKVYKSNNSGVNWTLINSSYSSNANGNVHGIASQLLSSNISFQVKACSLANCSGGNFIGPDNTSNTFNNLTGLNLNSRYFQYKVYLSREDLALSPLFYNISIGYTILDNTAPNLTIISPLNQSYNNTTILVNISASDSSGIGNIWFYNGSTNITYTTPVNHAFQQGSNIFIAYANDSFGNTNSSSVTFSVDSINPSISIIYPSQGAAFGFNTSINLNYSVSDSNLQACWHHIDSGVNITISNCQNTTFNVSDGSHTLNVYSNDSYGNLGISSIDFSVAVGAPSISLNSPNSNAYLNYTNIQFNYTATDVDLQSCELWGNFAGGFIVNQTNSSVISSQQSSFSLNLSDGSYIWNIRCNDTQGNSAFNGNRTLNIDTLSPGIAISEPSGTKTSITAIPILLSVSDASPTTCIYNVSFSSTGNIVISNTLISNCSSSSFDVDTESSYTLHLKVNDSAGNSRISSSNFSVSTSSSGGGGGSSGGGSSGGGGGGSSFGLVPSTTLQGRLEVGSISNMIINPGENKKLTLSIKNAGLSFLNSCKIIGSGDYSGWIQSSESKKLGGGESSEFLFSLNVPNDAKAGKYTIGINIECSETKETISFDTEIIEKKLNFNIIGVTREKEDNVKVRYSIDEMSGVKQNVEMQFLLFNSDNQKIAEVKDAKTITENSTGEFEVLIPINPSIEGDFNLLININSETYSTFVQESVVLGTPVSGFAIFQRDAGTDNIIAGVIIVLFLVFVFFMVWRIIRLKNRTMKSMDFK